MNLLEHYPRVIKEIITKEYKITLEQHADLFMVRYNNMNPLVFATLTIAIDTFEKLIGKSHRMYN